LTRSSGELIVKPPHTAARIVKPPHAAARIVKRPYTAACCDARR